MKFAFTVLSSILAIGVFFTPAQAVDTVEKSINDLVQIETIANNDTESRFGHEYGS